MNYLKIYIKLIKKAKSENRIKNNEIYYEAHHIKPKSLYPKFKNCDWNIVLLTAREHYIAHWLLSKALGKKMHSAFWLMNIQINNRDRYICSRGYEYARLANMEWLKSDNNPMKGNAWNKGIPKSDEHKRKLSEATKRYKSKQPKPEPKSNKGIGSGKYLKSDEHKQKLSEKMKNKIANGEINPVGKLNVGRKLSDEQKALLSQKTKESWAKRRENYGENGRRK